MLPFESVAMLCNGVELARLASTVAEIGNFLKGVAQQDVNLLIASV